MSPYESMNDDAVRVDRIEFRAAMPSLRLLDAASLAFSLQCMLPAIVGLLLVLGSNAFFPGRTGIEENPLGLMAGAVPLPLLQIMVDCRAIAVGGFSAGLTPFVRLPLFSLLVGMTGVAVSRAAGMRFCADRRNGAIRSMRHAAKLLRSIIVAASLAGLLCMAALGVFWLCLKITEFARLAHQPQSLTGAPAWLGASFLIVVACVCSVGWLLALAAMGVDSCDGAESLSRGISYVLSRFRRASVYSVILLVMTGGLAEAAWFLLTQAGGLVAEMSSSASVDSSMISLGFVEFRHFVVEVWKLTVFFSGVTVCYVLLRRAEDGVHLNESDSLPHDAKNPASGGARRVL